MVCAPLKIVFLQDSGSWGLHVADHICVKHQIETPIFIERQADLPESLEFPIRANHAAKCVDL